MPLAEFVRWCVEPIARIVNAVRAAIPNAPIIGFPRGAGTSLPVYVKRTGVTAIGLDWMIDPGFACAQVVPGLALQGNLDPLVLSANARQMLDAIADQDLRELVRDFYLDQRFRCDVFARDNRRLDGEKRCDRLLTSTFALARPAAAIRRIAFANRPESVG